MIHSKGAAERLHLFHKGDTPSDGQAARAAGIHFAYATWNGVGYGSVDHAACVLASPGDLLALCSTGT